MNKAIGLILLLSFVFSYGAVAQNRQLDSLLQLLPAAKADTNAILLYIAIGEQYKDAGDMNVASEYHLKAMALSYTLNYPHGIFETSDYYSKILKRLGMFDSAITVNKEAMAYAIKHNHLAYEANEKVYIGVGYAYKGFNETALTYYTEALNYYEKVNCTKEMAEVYYQIQTVYSRMGLYEDAIRYGEKALSLEPDTLSIDYGYVLLNLSQCYSILHPPQNEKAWSCLQKALHIAKLTGGALMEARTYNYIANFHFNANRLDECEIYHRKAIAQFNEDYMPNDFCLANLGLAKVAMSRNDYKKAEERGLKNLEVSRRYELRLEERRTLIFLWELYVARNDYNSRNRYKAAVDSIQQIVVNETMLRTAEELSVKYETEKKEIRIASLEEEKRLMTGLSIAGGGLLLSGLVALLFIWRWTVQKRRMAEQQKQIAEQQVRQLEQEKQLVATQAVFDGEVQERTRLARDLHDGMGGKLTAMKIQLQEMKRNAHFDDVETVQFNKVMDTLNDSVQEMRRVSHNLMPDTLSREGLRPAVDDFCHSMSQQIVFNYYGEETRLDLKLEALIYRCICELINNAVKYANASQIMVQIIQEADSIAFTVQDNGCGFDPATETKGIGLKNIRTRVASVGGDIHIDSKAGEGTEVNVELEIRH